MMRYPRYYSKYLGIVWTSEISRRSRCDVQWDVNTGTDGHGDGERREMDVLKENYYIPDTKRLVELCQKLMH
jgi:hypothetical protein